ncbi:hypothetical protein [Sphaerisporangium album]|nr:hypothetical protein [Sphaerisporangium album]
MTISQPQPQTRLCPACKAAVPLTEDMVVAMWLEDGATVEQIHAGDCPDYLDHQARLMESVERTRQKEERARQLFPDAHARFQAALQSLPAEQAAGPFAAALAELVSIQAGRFFGNGGFVILPEWADILDRHFPATGR